jgi:hypothetical protein
MGDLPIYHDLSPIWIAALKSPIIANQPPLIPFKFQRVEYLIYQPSALRGVEDIPIVPEPNFLFSHHTFAARSPFLKKKLTGFKKPDKTALEELRAALVRCYTENVSVDRMQTVWNFELIQSVMDI